MEKSSSMKQKKELLVTVYGKMVESMKGDSGYQCNDGVYRQKGISPINVELIGVVADIIMTLFDQQFLMKAAKRG